MALDINNLTPASIKAKEVATEEYVDTAVASSVPDLTSNNDAFAQNLGYADYAAMEAAASADNTIINGGVINSNLINAEAIVTDALSLNKGWAGVMYSQLNAAGTGPSTPNDYAMMIDFNNGEIHIS